MTTNPNDLKGKALDSRISELFDSVEKTRKRRIKKKTGVKPSPTKESNKPTKLVKPTPPISDEKKKNIQGQLVTIKELAHDHEVDAKTLRRILRKAKVSRPGGRWEWGSESPEFALIRKTMKAKGIWKS